MLDERWTDDVEEIGQALRKLLQAECSTARVREAEEKYNGFDADLSAELDAFGLREIEGTPELFARIAYELGRSLAPTAHVEMLPALAVLGLPDVALGLGGPFPACAPSVAVEHDGKLWIVPTPSAGRRSVAGDELVGVEAVTAGGRLANDGDAIDRLRRFAALTEAARLAGAAQGLLDYGVDYVRQREQFGKVIATYQGVSHRLVRAAGDVLAADLLVRKAAFVAQAEMGGDGAPPLPFAIMARAKAVDAGRTTATEVHQVFGGNGFAMEYDVQLFSRRIRNWALRGPRAGGELARLGRLMLDPAQRDAVPLLWHNERGLPLPRWAAEADAAARSAAMQ